MQKMESVIVVNHGIMSGASCFRGTRVPFQNLIDHLENSSLEDFLEDFPGVTREMAMAALEEAKRTDLLQRVKK